MSEYYSFNYLKIAEENFDLNNSSYLFVYNKKVGSDLILTLPSVRNSIGVSLTIKNSTFSFQVLSSVPNIKQIDGTINNIICTPDNFSSIVYDGINWLVYMTN